MKDHHKFKKVDFTNPDDLERQLLAKLDLSKMSALWHVEEEESKCEFHEIQGQDFSATVSKAPPTETRGLFQARLFPNTHKTQTPRGWPRFYFDIARAKREVECWLIFNGQLAIPSDVSQATQAA